MASLKEVRNRIVSVKSTQQITKAMKLVSASKLRRAQEAITRIRPYADKLYDLLGNIAAAADGEQQLQLAEEREKEKVLLIAISSDKGLAGSFNSNVIKLVLGAIREKYASQYESGNVEILTIGKKVTDYYRKRGYTINNQFTSLLHDLSFENAAHVAEYAVQGFLSGKYDVVEVIYSKFKNAAVQEFQVEQYLPIISQQESEESEKEKAVNFIFEPDKAQIMKELVPKILRTQFYRYLLDSNASEHGARMTAMDKASENANELLGDLKLTYNRARQAAITTELTEIVSGAAALEG